MSKVITPVEIPTPIPLEEPPDKLIAIMVAKDEAKILTRLLPTKIEPKSLLGSSKSLSSFWAPLMFCSIM